MLSNQACHCHCHRWHCGIPVVRRYFCELDVTELDKIQIEYNTEIDGDENMIKFGVAIVVVAFSRWRCCCCQGFKMTRPHNGMRTLAGNILKNPNTFFTFRQEPHDDILRNGKNVNFHFVVFCFGISMPHCPSFHENRHGLLDKNASSDKWNDSFSIRVSAIHEWIDQLSRVYFEIQTIFNHSLIQHK